MTLVTLTRTTALATALAGMTGIVQAQPYGDLSGTVLPPCAPNAVALDAGSLGPGSFPADGSIGPEQVLNAAKNNNICVTADARIVMQPPRGSTATAPVTEVMKPDPGEPAKPVVKPNITEVTRPTEKPSPDPAVKVPPKPAPITEVTTPPPGESLALTGGSGASEVSETTVTDENSRSSDEDFADKPGKPSNGGGLSAFEKFAIGAAGAVVVGSILNNREVVSNSGDRVVVQDDNGGLSILRDDDTLLRQPGSDVRTERFADGSTRSTVTRQNGSKIVTIADATGRVLKRTRINPNGRETVLIDDTEEVRPVDLSALPTVQPPPRQNVTNDRDALRAALEAEAARGVNRTFTLNQIRQFQQVRALMPEITLDSINFATGSAAITSGEAEELFDLGHALSDFIRQNPDELFLIEGHTDAVGNAAYNLTLSDRRAESVALALTEYFQVPPENMIIQGYGESELAIQTQDAERANRRATVRRITPLLR